jgi:hypothetical protein
MKRAILLCLLLILMDSSCAKLVPVPDADYRGTRADGREAYRLATRDGFVYEFKEFEATDSTLVILGVQSYGKTPSLSDPKSVKTPVVVPWGDVASLERIERHYVLPVLLAAAAGALLYGIIVFSEFDFY